MVSGMSDVSALFEPYTFRSGIQVRNRLVLAPMTTTSADPDDSVSAAELEYAARRSGGVGLAITAVGYVTPGGKGFHGQFGAEHDGRLDSLRALAHAMKQAGARAVLQIFHAGHQAPPELVAHDVTSASDVPSSQPGRAASGVPVRPLTAAEIQDIILDFGQATRRAVEAGFDGVEIHGANGYLIQQFVSAHSNRRTDEWGGTLENRLRFPLAVTDEVQRIAAQAGRPFLVGYRFSPEEPHEQGLTMHDTFALLGALREKNLDYVHVSLQDFAGRPRRGGHPERSRLEQIAEALGDTPLIGVGNIWTPQDAAQALNLGASFAALGRALLLEPEWVQKVQSGRAAEIRTTFTTADRESLTLPEPMWNMLTGFMIKDRLVDAR
ncbi:putative NADH-dependent flavin oxidoreductase YqiG [Deinococcus seoulensis]|uniref:NADH-dependent flavin oxidoreductase YqiG n=2 Tax=Deinococcus seoulensis TaxID=1837379 RepID=A0ABQ2RTR4_9DEIO|nr:putative NADH-dependent flavin oxidoreductase YqiG [Deinococcus seoulensis]